MEGELRQPFGDPGTARFVPVASYSRPFEAHLARGCLESHGIECLLADEHVVAIAWVYASAVGGVKLLVRDEESARARDILRAPRARSRSADWITADLDAPRCPRCGSLRVDDARFSRRLAFASWLLLGAPLPFVRRHASCGTCGARFGRPGASTRSRVGREAGTGRP